MTAMLLVEDLTVAFETETGLRVVNDHISFSVRAGEWVGIMGPSGCGKTVMAKALAGLIPSPPGVMSGRIVLHEKNLLDGLEEMVDLQHPGGQICSVRKTGRKWTNAMRKNRMRYAKNSFAYIAQAPREALNPYFTVERHLREAFAAGGTINNGIMSLAGDILSQLKFQSPGDVIHKYPHELSGGMAQRVVVAMALAQKAEVIIADECTTSLDPETGAAVVEVLQQARETTGCAVLFITHESVLADSFSDRVLRMASGKMLGEA